MPVPQPVASVCVSIVSHDHGQAVARLLDQLAALDEKGLRRVILTLNVPEPDLAAAIAGRAWPFDLSIIVNAEVKGFGANHNQAFAGDAKSTHADAFAVLNPDIVLRGNPFGALLRQLNGGDVRVGLVYPVQETSAGRRQDHERRLPTPVRLLRRHLAAATHNEVGAGERPDWVNAAFLLLRSEAYAEVGGFDEGYHMYCEDVDLSLRLQLAGWKLARVDDAIVIHDAQRASRSRVAHFAWHVRSLVRLWRSTAWRAYQAAQS